jgi:hypothetical protein
MLTMRSNSSADGNVVFMLGFVGVVPRSWQTRKFGNEWDVNGMAGCGPGTPTSPRAQGTRPWSLFLPVMFWFDRPFKCPTNFE